MKWNTKCKLCFLPSFVGICFFFVIPYIRMINYSFINNQFDGKFVGLSNYIKTINNEYFLLAIKNSMLIILVCVPILIILAIVLSLLISFGIKELRQLKFAFIIPMLVPTASITLIWSTMFAKVDNVFPIWLLFIWKNIGICIILISAAFSNVSKEIFEAAKIDGATTKKIHIRITIPIIMPTIVFSTLLSIVNSFKIFKESYLYYGTNYPPDSSYTLQYYMNNHFLKLNYQQMSTSAILTSFVILAIVLIVLKVQRRYQY